MTGAMIDSSVDLKASRVTAVVVCYSVPIPFMVLFTGLRIFVKLRSSSQNLMASVDYAIIGATCISIGLCIGLVYGPPYGFGRHKAALPTHELETIMMGDLVFSHFYNFLIVSTKLAILALAQESRLVIWSVSGWVHGTRHWGQETSIFDVEEEEAKPQHAERGE